MLCVRLRVAVALQVAPAVQTSSDENADESNGKQEERRTNAFPAHAHSLLVVAASLQPDATVKSFPEVGAAQRRRSGRRP